MSCGAWHRHYEPGPCPHCRGRGESQGIFCSSDGTSRILVERCSTCRGLGTLTPKRAAELQAGEDRRADRIARGLSQRQEAERLGITQQELSRLEIP